MNHKKISILLPNLGGGGAEKNYLMLANHWIKKNYLVEFVLLKKEGIFLKKLDKKIEIYNLNVNQYRYSFISIFTYLFKSKSDVLIVNLWPLTSITLILNFLLFKKIKIIVHDHQILSKSYSKEFNNHRWYLSLSLNLTYFLSNGVLAVSEAVKADLVKLGLNKKKITVINNPISLPDLSKKNINTSNNIKLWGNNAKYKILSIGSLKYEKDYLTLLKSISLISDKSNIKLAILGDGNEKQIIINSIKKLNLEKNVILPGFVPNLEDWYTSANLFVISSIHEGFGNVVAESLSYGLPVISTKSGGPVEILKNGTYGDLSPIQNAPFLSELLIKNLFNPNKRPKDKLINRAKDFDLFYISDLYIKYINKILSSV